jgi:hypothetical protein
MKSCTALLCRLFQEQALACAGSRDLQAQCKQCVRLGQEWTTHTDEHGGCQRSAVAALELRPGGDLQQQLHKRTDSLPLKTLNAVTCCLLLLHADNVLRHPWFQRSTTSSVILGVGTLSWRCSSSNCSSSVLVLPAEAQLVARLAQLDWQQPACGACGGRGYGLHREHTSDPDQ